MTIFYLSIPFMVLGLAIALVPLVIAMKHDQRRRAGPEGRPLLLPLPVVAAEDGRSSAA